MPHKGTPHTQEEERERMRESGVLSPPIALESGRPFSISTNQPSLNKAFSQPASLSSVPLSGALTEKGVLSREAAREMGGFRHLYAPEQFALLQQERAAQEQQELRGRIRGEEETRFQLTRSQIEEETLKQRSQEEEAYRETRQQVIGAGMAQSQALGFSSAIAGAMQFFEDKHKERLHLLEQAKKKAIEAGSVELFTRIAERISQAELQRDEEIGRILGYQAQELQNARQLAQRKEKPIEVAPGASLFDPETGAFIGRAPEKAIAEKSNLLEISPGASVFDPATGAFIGTAPEAPKTPTVKQVGDQLLEWNTQTKKWDSVYAAPKGEKSITETYGAGALGEYNFYAEQETAEGRKPLSFNEYQSVDANRRRPITNVYNTIQRTDREFVQDQLSVHIGSDGYVNTAVYRKLFDAWTGKHGAGFDKIFPPEIWLNPADSSAQRFLLSPSQNVTRLDLEGNILDVIAEGTGG